MSAARALSSKASNDIDRLCADIMVTELYPGLSDLLTAYCDKVTTAFMYEMCVRGKFDFDSVQNISMRSAEAMVSNLDRAPDKRELLRQAYERCPFCPDVYEKCLAMGWMDDETRQTACYFGCEEAPTPPEAHADAGGVGADASATSTPAGSAPKTNAAPRSETTQDDKPKKDWTTGCSRALGLLILAFIVWRLIS